MPGKVVDLRMPIGGVVRKRAYQKQEPFTTPDALNVRPDGTLLQRERIGSRPGLRKAFSTDVGSNPRLLAPLRWESAGVITDQLMISAGGGLHKSSGATFADTSPTLSLSSTNNLLGTELFQKLYIADYGGSTGTDGATDGTGLAFTSASVGDFSAAGINADDFVVVVVSGTNASPGVYQINTVSPATTLNLASSVGVNASAIKFFVYRAPKVYDPVDDSLKLLTASTGTVPITNPLMCVFRGRLFLGGGVEDPNNWYCSRLGDPTDWDYSQTDVKSAGAGSNTDAGKCADDLTALAPSGDQCMIMGAANSIWVMRGDPLFGGQLTNLTYNIGILDKHAWTWTQKIGPGEAKQSLAFMSRDGLWLIPDPCGTPPISLSREKIPLELLNIDPSSVFVQLAWDNVDRGIHIFLTESDSSTTTHWWYDWVTGGFWPQTYQSDHEPTVMARYFPSSTAARSEVMLAGRDGYVRQHDHALSQDDGSEIASHCYIGALRLGNGFSSGSLDELNVTVAANSGDIDVDVQVGASAEEAYNATAHSTYEFNDTGFHATQAPRLSGNAAFLKVKNGETGASSRWASEEVSITVSRTGGRRP